MNPQDTELQQQLEERLKTLPQAVQNAIASSDLEKRLRELSDKQKLHIDQWQKLENEVMLTLLGFQQAENLENNLIREVGVTAEIARALAENINTIVFEPIRQELERQLEHPAAQEATRYTITQVAGRPWREIFNWHPAQESDELPGGALSTTTRFEVECKRADGNRLILGMTLSPLHEQGRQTGFVGVFKDLTQIRDLEEEMRRKDWLASLGEMSAGIDRKSVV